MGVLLPAMLVIYDGRAAICNATQGMDMLRSVILVIMDVLQSAVLAINEWAAIFMMSLR